MDGCCTRKTAFGVTLIELMIVLAIIAITLLMAVPSMQSLVHSNQLRTQATRLMTAMNLVRSEAIARNLPVSMCPSSLAITGEAICTSAYYRWLNGVRQSRQGQGCRRGNRCGYMGFRGLADGFYHYQ